jgi:hypothetical protein
VKAASPAKKSAVTPGPGIALDVNAASCRNVNACCISGLVSVQVRPSGVQALAPQPVQTVASMFQEA